MKLTLSEVTHSVFYAPQYVALEKGFFAEAGLENELINGSYVAIIHPYAAYDLMRSPEFIEWHKYAQPGELYRGEIGMIGNVRFVKST